LGQDAKQIQGFNPGNHPNKWFALQGREMRTRLTWLWRRLIWRLLQARRRGTVFLFALRGLAPGNDCFLLKVYAISLAWLDCVMVYVQYVEGTAGRIG
jgi:hypothetical protein